MTKLYLIRHAESVANTLGIYQGQTYDTDLSSLGRNQAEALALALKSKKISKVYASPLRRTKQTAERIASVLNVDVEFNQNLLETNHGEWEGLTKGEIKEKHNGRYEAWLTNPADAYFPGGETFSETVARSEAFLNSIIFDEDVAIVTHDNIVRAILSLIEGKSINNMWEYELDPAGITEIEVDYTKAEFYKIIKINDTDHLRNFRADLSLHAL